MPTLDWIGKRAVLSHDRAVPFHLLEERAALSHGDRQDGNLIVQGDNLLALKSLLPYYAGKVKCIYIDPPYNTGNENWVYNDNVTDPTIKAWLGNVVGKEGGEEELCAQYIDQMEQVDCWVRNLDSRQSESFWLQLHNRHFYPDFVCRLKDGRILVVEHKGADRYSNEDSIEKRTIGELWAARSHGHCLFVMTCGKNFHVITDTVRQ